MSRKEKGLDKLAGDGGRGSDRRTRGAFALLWIPTVQGGRWGRGPRAILKHEDTKGALRRRRLDS